MNLEAPRIALREQLSTGKRVTMVFPWDAKGKRATKHHRCAAAPATSIFTKNKLKYLFKCFYFSEAQCHSLEAKVTVEGVAAAHQCSKTRILGSLIKFVGHPFDQNASCTPDRVFTRRASATLSPRSSCRPRLLKTKKAFSERLRVLCCFLHFAVSHYLI